MACMDASFGSSSDVDYGSDHTEIDYSKIADDKITNDRDAVKNQRNHQKLKNKYTVRLTLILLRLVEKIF